MLSSAEAAHRLTREASGESLPYVPRQTPAGYVLALRLTPAERSTHAARVLRAARVSSGTQDRSRTHERQIITDVTQRGPYFTVIGTYLDGSALNLTLHASVYLSRSNLLEGRALNISKTPNGRTILPIYLTPAGEHAIRRASSAARECAGIPNLTAHRIQTLGTMSQIVASLKYPDGERVRVALPYTAVLSSGRHPKRWVTVFWGCPIEYPRTSPMFTAEIDPHRCAALTADLYHLPDMQGATVGTPVHRPEHDPVRIVLLTPTT